VSARRWQRVAAYALCQDADHRVLLARGSALSDDVGRWFLPGGGVDFGEEPEAAVVRELREEAGLDVAVGELLAVLADTERPAGRDLQVHSVRIVYRAHVLRGSLRNEVDGSTDLIDWFDLATARALPLMPYVERALRLLDR
jgi:8-oxo-dGTP diphosphatase